MINNHSDDTEKRIEKFYSCEMSNLEVMVSLTCVDLNWLEMTQEWGETKLSTLPGRKVVKLSEIFSDLAILRTLVMLNDTLVLWQHIHGL